MLNVSERHAQMLCIRGKLPAINVSIGARYKRWRVKLSDLIRFRDTPDNQAEPPPVSRPMRLPPGVIDRLAD